VSATSSPSRARAITLPMTLDRLTRTREHQSKKASALSYSPILLIASAMNAPSRNQQYR
jgi:hypothetical protein